MNAQQFVAPTARDALRLVRQSIGPDAVILSNRAVPEGVAVTAIAESDLNKLDVSAAVKGPASAQSTETPAEQVRQSAPSQTPDTPMSTANFESFSKVRKAKLNDALLSEMPNNPATDTRMELHRSEPVPVVQRSTNHETLGYMQTMVEELRQMRGFIRQQFSALAWVDGVRRTPAQARLLKVMIESGFSAKLARVMVSRLPAELAEESADRWLRDGLVRNLRTACFDDGMLQKGGVFALIGPTGVGKTTSAAKIAARYALLHGPDSVGLISADVYRVAGQEQLARYGRMIGIKVLTARDADELRELLVRLEDKSLILIDTAGLGQRDPRVANLLEVVTQGPIRRLVVMSASAQAESLEETLEAYRADESAGVLLTKIDEACRLGGALDTVIRHRLPLHAIGNGQRVPEDWMAADAEVLIDQALEGAPTRGSQIADIDLTMLMQRIETTDQSICAPVATAAPPADNADTSATKTKSTTRRSTRNV